MVLCLFSCSDTNDKLNDICGTTDPKEELEWLKGEITTRKRDVSENAKYYYITQADFEGQVVFLYSHCDPKANSAIPVHNCEGELLGAIGKEFNLDQFVNTEIIFKPIDFACEE